MLLEIAVLWAVTVGAVGALAWRFEIGPVEWQVTANHGVHAGDVVFVAVGWAIAGVGTLRLLAAYRRRSPE